MLPDQVTELLTAFVDGELSQRQRKAALQLLERSSEAREFLRQLQENAHKVKQLPRRKVEPSLVDEILRAIAEQKAQPMQPLVKPARRRRWVPYVVAGLAASVLIAAIGVAYMKSMGDWDAKGGNTIVKENGKPEPTRTPPQREEVPAPPAPKKVLDPRLARITEGTFGGFIAPIVDDRPFLAKFSDLKKDGAAAGQLTHELNKGRTVQFDITVKNNKLAIERLQAALQENFINIAIDPTAKKALADTQQTKGEYWVFAENLTSDELTKLMSELSRADTSSMGGSVPTPYEKVAVTPLTQTEKQKLSGMLGVDVKKLELPKDNGNAKPGTPKRWDRTAVVLPISGAAQPSNEVRQFVERRRPPQPGTLQILIKIHQE